MRVLVVNAGSSSLKLRVLDDRDALVESADLGAPDGPHAVPDIEAATQRLGQVDAVGHRVVHGGAEFTGPVRIDTGVQARLDALTDLAPLHQPKSLAGIAAVTAALPNVPAVACFDTAFHATLPDVASTYAIPEAWRRRWAIRRYGFHGLSHAYASRRAEELWGADPPQPFRVVTCHLGAGASLAAVLDGRSIDTTMGFTPLEGLVMATRSGSVDPGLVLWLQTHAGLSAKDVTTALDRKSGLAGLGGSADMRDILAGVGRGDERAILAFEVYMHRLVGAIAAMAASLGGLDGLVFTGGVGEHAPAVRARASDRLRFLGVSLASARNEASGPPDREISAEGSPVRAFVLEAREDLQIAREVRGVLA